MLRNELLSHPTLSSHQENRLNPYTLPLRSPDVAIPISMTMEVKDAGNYRAREGAINKVIALTELDEEGRPLREEIDSDDTRQRIQTDWYYDGDGGYESVTVTTKDDGEVDTVTKKFEPQPDGSSIFSSNGSGVRVAISEANDGIVEELIADDGEVLERLEYDSTGRLVRFYVGERDKPDEFIYKSDGSLSEIRSPYSGIYFGSEVQPSLKTFHQNADGTLDVLGSMGDIESLKTSFTFDDGKRPLKVDTLTGFVDVQRTSIVAEFTY